MFKEDLLNIINLKSCQELFNNRIFQKFEGHGGPKVLPPKKEWGFKH